MIEAYFHENNRKSFLGTTFQSFLLFAIPLVLLQHIDCDLFDLRLIAINPGQFAFVGEIFVGLQQPALGEDVAEFLNPFFVFFLELCVHLRDEMLENGHEELVGKLLLEEIDVHGFVRTQIPEYVVGYL